MAKQGAEFVQWMPHVLEALRRLGGSASPREVYDEVALIAKVPDEKRFAKLDSGSLRFPNQVAWARQYLLWENYLASQQKGVWTLTPTGAKTILTPEQAREIFLKWVAIFAERRKSAANEKDRKSEVEKVIDDQIKDAEKLSPSEDVLEFLQGIDDKQFEHFCGDLLRHIGYEDVRVSGGSGDGGIDGFAYLTSEHILRTKVGFQCKRYRSDQSVGPDKVSNFLYAVSKNAQRGILFTTSYFTKAAREVAARDATTPVELIDGEQLVALLQKHQFALREVKSYEADWPMLEQYRIQKPAVVTAK